MLGRKPNKSEQDFMDAICAIGCCVCLKHYGVYTECSPHHMDGRTKPGAHYKVIGLCGPHHNVPDTQKPPRWYTRHHNKTEFEKAYGSEMDLYHYALELLND